MVAGDAAKVDPLQQADALALLGQSLKAASADKALRAHFETAKLAEAAPWLGSAAQTVTAVLLDDVQAALEKLQLAGRKVEATQLPSVEDEQGFRKAALPVVGQLAQLAGSGEAATKTLRDLRLRLRALAATTFGEEGGVASLLQSWEQKHGHDALSAPGWEQASCQVVAGASFQVAAVAGLCALRSEQVEAKESKALKNLADVTATLQDRWESLGAGTCLKKAGASLLQACQATLEAASAKPPKQSRKAKPVTSAPGDRGDQAAVVVATGPVGGADQAGTAQAKQDMKTCAGEGLGDDPSAKAEKKSKKEKKAEKAENGEKKKDKKKKDKGKDGKDKESKKAEKKEKAKKDGKESADKGKSKKEKKTKGEEDEKADSPSKRPLKEVLEKTKALAAKAKAKAKGQAKGKATDEDLPEPKAKAKGRGRGRGRGR